MSASASLSMQMQIEDQTGKLDLFGGDILPIVSCHTFDGGFIAHTAPDKRDAMALRNQFADGVLDSRAEEGSKRRKAAREDCQAGRSGVTEVLRAALRSACWLGLPGFMALQVLFAASDQLPCTSMPLPRCDLCLATVKAHGMLAPAAAWHVFNLLEG